ncbi:MAG: alpha/beta hydrolase family protein [Myxococcota bacterium]
MIRQATSVVLVACVALGCNGPAEPDGPVVGAGPAETMEWDAPTDGFDLSGTLLLPDREGPVPVVVLVHGSGANSRDQPMSGQLNFGFGVEIGVFAQLATQLQDRGVAVYRYDKRSCGPFNGCADNGYPAPANDVTVFTFAEDAVAATASLRDNPAIDPERIWVVGHSQGGQLVPQMVRDGQLAGGILLAAPHDPVDEGLRDQLSFTIDLLRESGATQAAIDATTADLKTLVEGTQALRSGTHDSSAIGGASAAFWASWMQAGDDAPGIAAGLDQPLLALGGDYDWNVPSDQLDGWRSAFATHDGVREAKELACITHALNCVSQPDWKLVTPADISSNVSADVSDKIAEFILQTR